MQFCFLSCKNTRNWSLSVYRDLETTLLGVDRQSVKLEIDVLSAVDIDEMLAKYDFITLTLKCWRLCKQKTDTHALNLLRPEKCTQWPWNLPLNGYKSAENALFCPKLLDFKDFYWVNHRIGRGSAWYKCLHSFASEILQVHLLIA